MKHPRHILGCVALLLLLALPLGAWDFGLTLDNTTSPGYAEGFSFEQQDTLALWFETGLGPFLRLSMQGSYTFEIERPYLFNLDLLALKGQFPLSGRRPSVLAFTLGRFVLAEFSGLLFEGTVDGAQLEWRGQALTATVAAGYTGLQLAPLSPVAMTWADQTSTSTLAPPRLVELLQLEFPELLSRQDLTVAAVAQQDFQPESELVPVGTTVQAAGAGGRLSSEYLGLGMRGPLRESLYYDLFGYLGTGRTLSYIDGSYQYAWMLSGLLGGGLRWFQEAWLHSRAEMRFLMATGDPDFAVFTEGNQAGLATMFVPVTQSELALVFSPSLGNLAVLQLGYSIKPAAWLQTELTGFMFLRPGPGPVSDPRLDPASSTPYLGSEIDASVRLRPFSDVGTALTLGLFLPGTAFRADYRALQLQGSLGISLAF